MSRLIKLITVVSILYFLSSCSSLESGAGPGKLNLPRFTAQQLQSDFNLLVNSLKEAHTGLYWYSTPAQFDSIVNAQKALISDNMDVLAFYNVVAPIVAFTKEDHCDISLPEDVKKTINAKGLFLPFIVYHSNQRTFITNSPFQQGKGRGYEIVSINGVKIEDINNRLFNTFAADGFNLTSKYRYLDDMGLAREYARVFGQQFEDTVNVITDLGKTQRHIVKRVDYDELKNMYLAAHEHDPVRWDMDKPATMFFVDNDVAVLTIRTFSNDAYKKEGMDFKKFLDSAFNAIRERPSDKLIIDIRENGGGSEGNEDILFSYFDHPPYTKYKHVQASALTFSFLEHTDYAKPEDRAALENELKNENELGADSQYYRKPGIYIPAVAQPNPFKGSVVVLTSGWTYSGGAEFAALMKEHTDAIFVGEETGGGYYGNTSGTILALTLPNSKLVIDIPILKFVLDVKKGEPGRGVIPDKKVNVSIEKYLSGIDAEMNEARKMLRSKK